MAKILVIGCGDVGYKVAQTLSLRGHQVTGLKRKAPLKPTSFPIMNADIRQASTLSALPTEFDLVLFIVSAGSRQAESIQREPPLYTNRIHYEDCIAVLLFLVEKLLAGESLHRCYLASDNDPAPLWDVMSWIAEQFAYPAPGIIIKEFAAEQNKRCSNARLRALGYRFLFSSYRDGYVKAGQVRTV